MQNPRFRGAAHSLFQASDLRWLFGFIGLGTAFLASTIHAQPANFFWSNPGTGNWIDGANWEGGVPPDPYFHLDPDAPGINNGGTAIITTATGAHTIHIGEYEGTSGFLTLDGPAASVGMGGGASPFTFIGASGIGAISVLNGAIYKSESAASFGTGNYLIGNVGSGSLLVDGVGSKFNSFASIFIGTYGTGTMTVSNGGMVGYYRFAPDHETAGFFDSVRVAEQAGSVGTINIGGAVGGPAAGAGFLNLKTVEGGSGTSYLNFNHTATSATPYYFTRTTGDPLFAGDAGSAGAIPINIVGGIRVTNTNGFTILNGVNTYTGGTTVDGGTLQAGSATAFTSGTPFVVTGGTLDLNNFALTASSLSGTGGTVALGSATLTVAQSTFTSYDGVISGTGALVKTGSGELVLSSPQAYTGTTTIDGGSLRFNGDNTALTGLITVNNSGILRGTGTLGGSVVVNSGGTLSPGNSPGTLNILGDLTLNAGSNSNFELGQVGVVGGAFNDLVNVSGNLTLDGNLNVSQSAGGTFGAGLYRLINYDGSLTNNGLSVNGIPVGYLTSDLYVQTSVANQVNLINTLGLDLTFWDGNGTRNNGVISGGSGTWEANPGNDNWTLADATVNGPWRGGSYAVFAGTAGTITVSNASGPVSVGGIQFASDGYVVQGGTLTTTAPSTEIRVGDGSAGGASYVARIDSTITGAGGLDKVDLGTLIIGGTNTYTGATTISGGEIRLDAGSLSATQINAGARLTGNGTINGNLVNNGALSPGNSPGLINVAGDFTNGAGGTYFVEIAGAGAGQFDQLIVSGTANLAGTLDVAPLPGFVFAPGQTFEIISAGAINGTFDTVNSPWGFISATVLFETLYNPNNVTLSFTQLPFASFGLTPNQVATGQGIDDALALGTIPNLVNALNTSPTAAAVVSSLNELSPQRYERLFEQAVYLSESLVGSAENRLASARLQPGMNLWTQAVHTQSHHGSDADITSADGRSNGVLVGFDTPVTNQFTAGLLFRYTDDNIRLDREGSRTESEHYTLAAYARYTLPDAWFVEAVAGAGFADNDQRRQINVPGFVRTAEGDNSSSERFVSVRAGRSFTHGNFNFTPYVGIQHTRWQADGFTETGADEASLTLGSQRGESLATRTGVTLGYVLGGESWPKLVPTLDVAWRHEFQQSRRGINAEIGGTPFTVESQNPNIDGATFGAGADILISENLTLFGRLNTEWNSSADRVLEINGGLSYRF